MDLQQLTKEQLLELATKLGFEHHPNLGTVKLLDGLTEHTKELGTTLQEVADELYDKQKVYEPKPINDIISTKDLSTKIDLSKLTFASVESEQETKDAKLRAKAATKLVRVIISCNDKNKTSYQGEIFHVANNRVKEKKYIQFGVPYHVTQIMLNVIKEKQIQQFRKQRLPNGMVVTRAYSVPAYNIQHLDPITPAELDAIKKKQLAEGFTGE